MIQSVNPTPTDETDGLPMPRRIWAVISVGFALCMSVLDVNIINIVLPTLSHDFGTSPAVTTWIINDTISKSYSNGRNRRTTNAQTYLGGNLRRIRSLYVSIGR